MTSPYSVVEDEFNEFNNEDYDDTNLPQVPDTDYALPPSPDIGDFDNQGQIITNQNSALQNAPDRYAFSTLIARILEPQLHTELEPFKTGYFVRPKQQKALDVMLTLFRYIYTADVHNRFGLMEMLEKESDKLIKDSNRDEIRESERCALAYANARHNINTIQRMPLARMDIAEIQKYKEILESKQQIMIDTEEQALDLTIHSKAYYYYRIYWLDIVEWIAQDRLDGKPFVDYTEVRRRWAEGEIKPGMLVSSMPWAYQVAYQMLMVTQSDGDKFRNLFRDIFTHTNSSMGPMSGRQMRGIRSRAGGFLRRRQGGQGGGNYDDGGNNF